ncbi:hypothetical protein D3C80_1091570 [compost metagenome]
MLRRQLFEQGADGVHHVEVLLLVVAADIVRFADLSVAHYFKQRPRVVFDEQPVTHLLAIAIHRQWLAGQGIEDHQRDQLFGEMVWAVVVRAVGDQHRQAVSTVPGAYQVVRGGLARRIG